MRDDDMMMDEEDMPPEGIEFITLAEAGLENTAENDTVPGNQLPYYKEEGDY